MVAEVLEHVRDLHGSYPRNRKRWQVSFRKKLGVRSFIARLNGASAELSNKEHFDGYSGSASCKREAWESRANARLPLRTPKPTGN